ncbi:MAG TPA: FecR domain-containing protein [Candidatus Binataceae bacterium]
MKLIAQRWTRLAAATLAGATMIMLVSAARAQGPQIAQVKTATGDAAVIRSGARLAAKAGDPIYEKDTIETGESGAIGLTFIDNTVMSAGPNSEIDLAEYRFDSGNFRGAMLTDMRKGTLTVVSGDIARSSPGAMRVKTPAAMLGVRGTRFAVQVEGSRW